MEKVILVDKLDNPIGEMEKQEAHVKGLLHRAFSIFIFNDKEEILLHQRAHHKYHSGGLWTNTCCSHPRPGEHTHDAANRRLVEEMGMVCTLKEQFSFIYKAKLDNDLFEHELDHVFIGHSNDTPHLNTDEAVAFKWISLMELKKDIQNSPEKYTVWFKIMISEYYSQIEAHLS